MHVWENALLHGIATAFDVSNFRLAFLRMSLYSSSLGPKEKITLYLVSGMFELRFLYCPFLAFLFFERLFPILVQASSHM